MISAVGQLHAHQNIARHKAAWDGYLLATAKLNHFLLSNENFYYLILEALFGHGVSDLLGDALLKI